MKKTIWQIPLIVLLILSTAGPQGAKALSGPQFSAWWSPEWHYRIRVEVNSGRFARDDEPIELKLDFETIFSRSGIFGTLDPNSIRVTDQSRSPREVVSQFEPASGETIWLTGSMEAGASKTYYVYFDILENGPKSPPRYYDSMENGGILALPVGGDISVVYKIGGNEFEVARINEADGEVGYLKPPLGSPLINGGGSFLGFKKKEGVLEGGVVSITGGPLRYSIAFHLEPAEPKSAIAYSDYVYTFYYVSNGREVRTKFANRWAASQSFVPQYEGAGWPIAFGMQGDKLDRPATAFLATAEDTATSYDVLATWGPVDRDNTASPVLADNFWGVYGEDGGIGIIPTNPKYDYFCVDGYRSTDAWNWTTIHKSQVDLIEKGTYGCNFWIYGYNQKGWDLAKNFGNNAQEPIIITADPRPSSSADADSNQKTRTRISRGRDGSAFRGSEDRSRTSDPQRQESRTAWLGSGWTYRKSLTFNNSAQTENLVNFPVLVILTSANFDYSHCQFDGRDIRFVDADDTTLLKYQIEKWDPAGNSFIWVKVPQIDGSSAADYIWMYYGNAAASDAQDPENVWDANYMGVWHLNEAVTDEVTTGIHYDSTANNNDGRQRRNVNIAGRIAEGQSFDGNNDYVEVPDAITLDNTNRITLEAWVYPRALPAASRGIVSKRVGSNTQHSYSLYFSNAARRLYVDIVNTNDTFRTNASFSTNNWYHVATVYDGNLAVAQRARVYVNGTLDRTATESSATIPDNASNLFFGILNSGSPSALNGIIDEVRISNSARSANWIAAQYRSMSNNFITFGTEAAATITIEDRADGSGAEIDTRAVASGDNFVGYAIQRDASGNFVDNVAATWSLIDLTGGVVSGDLVPSGDFKSAIFTGNVVGTGRIRAQHASLGEDTTSVITVIAGVGASIRIEDSADGSGAEIDTRTVASGGSFVAYAISRDAIGNFADNVAVTWSLIDLIGGVVSGDLVPSGDFKSASFTGNVVGTGRIRAQHASLGEDTTGVITVTAGVAANIKIEDSAEGSGAEIDTRTVASGGGFVGYAISRDASGNFVDNVAVTWSLIDLNGGVVSGDLVPSGDFKSASFTGNVVGTGRIRAQHASLGEDTTGVITVTAGAATSITIEDSADGSGAEIDTRTVASGGSFVGYAISRDASGNFVDNVAVTWSLIDLTGGVVSGDLLPSGDFKSATFTGNVVGTGRIRAQHASLGEDTTGVITVTVGAATRIRIEDSADGTGAEIDTRTVASGGSFVGYAISRDASGNFVDNVAVTWSLINRTGGVVDGDLVPSGDLRSATFTGHAMGTAIIRAQQASLGEDTTGVIAVTAGVGASIRIEDRAYGTGAEIDTRTVASGGSFVGYAISRDASGNFVDNVAVTWSLINRTGGVVDGDLVPSGDLRSATFTGHAMGTAIIRAQHASLGEDTTGIITVTAGVGASIRIEDRADGTGIEIDTRTVASGGSFAGYAISRDASGNFVDNVAVTWSLINRTGGVVDGDLVPSGDLRSATFTGHTSGTAMIRAQHASLGEDTTGVITVTAGAATRIRIEDRADGAGAEIDTRTVASGGSFVGYAISRDASGNFIDNVAVTWSLINRTGGVVDSDLVPSGDLRSATFTGHTSGTARIMARHATLGYDVTGVITVAAAGLPPVAIFNSQPTTGSAPCEICFDASLSYDPDGRIVSYDWDFGDGSSGHGVNICHTYTFNGEFIVTLRVTDSDGLSDTATHQIVLQAAVYPPINVFIKREINRSLFRKEAFHTLSWSVNPKNGGLTITSYRIYRKEGSKGDEQYQLIGTVSGDAFVYVDGYLDINKKYIYAVTSVESSGQESQFSLPVGN